MFSLLLWPLRTSKSNLRLLLIIVLSHQLDSDVILAFCFNFYPDLFIFTLLYFIYVCKLPQYLFLQQGGIYLNKYMIKNSI